MVLTILDIVDPEGNSLVFTDTSTSDQALFSLSGNTYFFYPDYNLANGTAILISFEAYDGVNTASWQFYLIITNLPPYLASPPVN